MARAAGSPATPETVPVADAAAACWPARCPRSTAAGMPRSTATRSSRGHGGRQRLRAAARRGDRRSWPGRRCRRVRTPCCRRTCSKRGCALGAVAPGHGVTLRRPLAVADRDPAPPAPPRRARPTRADRGRRSVRRPVVRVCVAGPKSGPEALLPMLASARRGRGRRRRGGRARPTSCSMPDGAGRGRTMMASRLSTASSPMAWRSPPAKPRRSAPSAASLPCCSPATRWPAPPPSPCWPPRPCAG